MVLTLLIAVFGLLVIAGLSVFIVRTLRPAERLAASDREKIVDGAPLGSPARAWQERGEQAVRELRVHGVELAGMAGLLGEVEAVLGELRADAATVTTLNARMAEQHPNRLRERYERLAAEARRASDPASEAACAAASRELAEVEDGIAERDRLLRGMEAAVLGLEVCGAELRSWLDSDRYGSSSGGASRALHEHVVALRAAHAEVRELNVGEPAGDQSPRNPGGRDEPIRSPREPEKGDTGPVAGQG